MAPVLDVVAMNERRSYVDYRYEENSYQPSKMLAASDINLAELSCHKMA